VRNVNAWESRPRRLQIRVSVDEHMGELFTSLEAIPPTLRGRELVSLARVACGLKAAGAAVAALLPSGGLAGTGPLAPHRGGPDATGPVTSAAAACVDFSNHAAEHATSTFEAAFLLAVPPTK
jgi:hypothetical protein